MRNSSILRGGIWAAAIVLVGLVVVFYAAGAPGLGARSGAPEPAYGSPFALVDQTGETVNRNTLMGEPSAVFFGYTHCPDVCPTTLFELASYQKQIEAEGGDFRIVFVTVDPERDTPDVMKSYVEAVGGDITALTGAPKDIDAMLKGWGIYAKKVGEGASYDMDHTSKTLLLDANGALSGTIAYGENAEEATAKLEKLAGV